MFRTNKKAILLATMILISVFIVPVVFVTADEPRGSTLHVPGDFPGNTGIQDAIDAADPGDRIEVDDGVYNWFVVPWWKPGLQIVAVGENVYVAGPGPTLWFIGVTIFADDTLLKDFHVASYWVGIAVFSDRCMIRHNDVMENSFIGIAIVNGDDNVVKGNHVHDASPAFTGIWCGGLPGAPSAVTPDMSNIEMQQVGQDALGIVESLYAHEPVHVKDDTGQTDVDYMLPDPAETDYALPVDEEEIESTFGGDTPMSKFFVEDNMFINNGVFGYYIGIHIAWFTSGSYVIRNEVADCYIGILVGPIAWKALLKYNHVHRNIWGIVVFLNVYEVIIRENTVGGSGNVIGIALILVTDVDVLRNNVLHNEQGIIAYGAPWFSLWSYDIRINRNEVHHNDGNGIWVHGCYDFRMKYNTVHDNGWGAPVGGSGIEVLASMNGRVGGRWRARNEVYDNAGDGIAVRVSNEIMVKKNRVFDNGGYALFWFHLPSGWPAPLWTEPGRVRFIGNKNNFGHLLVPVIMSP